jgi:hypothetical protein
MESRGNQTRESRSKSNGRREPKTTASGFLVEPEAVLFFRARLSEPQFAVRSGAWLGRGGELPLRVRTAFGAVDQLRE